MTDAEFMTQAEALLCALEANCDRINDATGADIDNQRTGGMVTLAFSGGSQMVINLQKPLHEVWLAARSGGYHFRWNGAVWLDTKTGQEFWQRLSADASAQAALALVFQALPAS